MTADTSPAPDPSTPGRGLPPAPGADPYETARQIALRQLTMAPRSRAQLTEKMLARGCEEGVVERVLDRLEEVGLIDDVAFAEGLVRSQLQSRGLARRGLEHELRRRGIDEETAQQAVEQELGGQGERAHAEQLVARRLRTLAGLDRQVKARRLAGMLARKGYSGELAWAVVREALESDPEHARD